MMSAGPGHDNICVYCSACAKKGGLAGDQNGLFPTEIQAREHVGQERKVREQRKHEPKG